MTDKIQEILNEIEVGHNVKVLFACESGSRAWGFDSRDSDFDVRFIYVREPTTYLNIFEPKRDVIEVVDKTYDLDIVGWDLKKALQLFHKSNPSLMEWLNTEIVYRNIWNFQERLRELAQKYHSPTVMCYHYLHMAKGNYREYLKSSHVWLKKYLYVLRPILAIRWLEEGNGLIPMRFEDLLYCLNPDATLRQDIEDLIKRKREGFENKYGFRIDSINRFIESEIERHELNHFVKLKPKSDIDTLNDLFKFYLSLYEEYLKSSTT